MGCFDRRDEMELLGLALMCQRLIDVAIDADRAKKTDWWPEGEDFHYNKRRPSYAKTYVVCQILGDAEYTEHREMLRKMPAKKAIETLLQMEKRALWQMHRELPRPDLSKLFGSPTSKASQRGDKEL